MITNESIQEHLRAFRGLRGEPCKVCDGWGCRNYSNTSTWRKGVGGASITRDVCDSCWGSGEEGRPWLDLRKLAAEEEQRVATRALRYFAEECGAGLSACKPGTEALAGELEKLSRGRKERPYFFRHLAGVLAKKLRKAVADGEAWRLTQGRPP